MWSIITPILRLWIVPYCALFMCIKYILVTVVARAMSHVLTYRYIQFNKINEVFKYLLIPMVLTIVLKIQYTQQHTLVNDFVLFWQETRRYCFCETANTPSWIIVRSTKYHQRSGYHANNSFLKKSTLTFCVKITIKHQTNYKTSKYHQKNTCTWSKPREVSLNF